MNSSRELKKISAAELSYFGCLVVYEEAESSTVDPATDGSSSQPVKKSRRGPRSRSSQYRGVTYYRRTGRWESHIWIVGNKFIWVDLTLHMQLLVHMTELPSSSEEL